MFFMLNSIRIQNKETEPETKLDFDQLLNGKMRFGAYFKNYVQFVYVLRSEKVLILCISTSMTHPEELTDSAEVFLLLTPLEDGGLSSSASDSFDLSPIMSPGEIPGGAGSGGGRSPLA